MISAFLIRQTRTNILIDCNKVEKSITINWSISFGFNNGHQFLIEKDSDIPEFIRNHTWITLENTHNGWIFTTHCWLSRESSNFSNAQEKNFPINIHIDLCVFMANIWNDPIENALRIVQKANSGKSNKSQTQICMCLHIAWIPIWILNMFHQTHDAMCACTQMMKWLEMGNKTSSVILEIYW